MLKINQKIKQKARSRFIRFFTSFSSSSRWWIRCTWKLKYIFCELWIEQQSFYIPLYFVVNVVAVVRQSSVFFCCRVIYL